MPPKRIAIAAIAIVVVAGGLLAVVTARALPQSSGTARVAGLAASATVVRDAGTASITGAFTVADRRAEGIAGALLDAAVGWARSEGYARCAVDHDSANVEAARFWRRHFTPVAYSLTRRLAPRLAR